MKKTNLKSPLLLFLAAVIWGVAFVAQSVGMEYVGPFTFSCVRSIIGGLVLLPVIWFMNGKKKKTPCTEEERQTARKNLLLGGTLCGLCLFAATNFQQFGILYTTAGKAGFITACYIVLVPVFSIFLGKKCARTVWLSVALAVAGLYLLCITGDLTIGRGDILVFVCALLFSIHILVIDHFSPLADGVKLSCIQFFVCGILSGVGMFLTEEPHLLDILAAWMPILYAGAMSCGVAYTLQIVGQKDMNPTVASLILSLESCVSVLAGWLLLGQALTGRELLGCAAMFIAIILAQLPERK